MNSGSPAFLASPTTGALPLRNATNWLDLMLTDWPSCSMSIAPLFSEPMAWPPLVTPTIPSVPRIEQVAVPVLNLNELPSFCFWASKRTWPCFTSTIEICEPSAKRSWANSTSESSATATILPSGNAMEAVDSNAVLIRSFSLTFASTRSGCHLALPPFWNVTSPITRRTLPLLGAAANVNGAVNANNIAAAIIFLACNIFPRFLIWRNNGALWRLLIL